MTAASHPDGEALTAYVDGAVDADERAAIDAHVRVCTECARAVAEERAVAGAVRGLRGVDVPEAFFAQVLAHGPAPVGRARRASRFALANLAAAAAVWLGVVGVTHVTGRQTVRPAVASLRDAHAAMLARLTGGAPAVAAAADTDAADDDAPGELDDAFHLAALRVVDGRRQAVYVDDAGRVLSVFVQPGQLDREALPAGAERVDVGGAEAWRVTTDEQVVVVVPRSDAVVMLVGTTGADDSGVVTDAGGRPPRPSMAERVRAAAHGVLDTFGLG